MKQPVVSIIVAAYNSDSTLPVCIKSLEYQTLKDIEIILINDGSTDRTEELMKAQTEKDNRFQMISQKNNGAFMARMAGIAQARGYYVGFVDADDTVEPEMYKKMYDTAIAEHADLVMCDYNEVWGKSVQRCVMNLRPIKINGPSAEEQIYLDFVSAVPSLCNKLYRKDLFFDLPSILPLKIGEDMALCTALSPKIHCAVAIPEGLYNYVQNNNSVMHRRHEQIGEPNQIDQFLADIAENPIYDSPNDQWKNLLAARAFISVIYTGYSDGQGLTFFRNQLEKLKKWPGYRRFCQKIVFGNCLNRLQNAGGVSAGFALAVRTVFFLCRLHLTIPASGLLSGLRRILERKQGRSQV